MIKILMLALIASVSLGCAGIQVPQFPPADEVTYHRKGSDYTLELKGKVSFQEPALPGLLGIP